MISGNGNWKDIDKLKSKVTILVTSLSPAQPKAKPRPTYPHAAPSISLCSKERSVLTLMSFSGSQVSQDTLKNEDPPVTRSSSPIKRTPSPIEKRIMTKSSSGRFRARSPPLEREKPQREGSQPTSMSSWENKSRRNSSAPKATEQEQRQKPTAKKKFGLFFMGHSACQ